MEAAGLLLLCSVTAGALTGAGEEGLARCWGAYGGRRELEGGEKGCLMWWFLKRERQRRDCFLERERGQSAVNRERRRCLLRALSELEKMI